MIIDHISNRANYYCLGNDFKIALDYFAMMMDKKLTTEDIKIENSDVVVKIRPMTTKEIDKCSFEAHKDYADIHFVTYGTEKIGYSNVDELKTVNYSKENDFIELLGEGDVVTLRKGYFMIVLPQDAHMPCICADKPENIGKLIAKIKM